MRRGNPEVLVATLILLLLGSYVWYTQHVLAGLRRDAAISGEMYRRVYHALNDPDSNAADAALFDLSKSIQAQGVPLIVTDFHGTIGGHANLPFEDPSHPAADDDPRVAQYIPILQAQHRPIVDTIINRNGTVSGARVYFGDPAVARGLRVIPALQALTAALLLFLALYIIRTRGDAVRERLWAGMARESAHQLGTPLSSLSGWIELLEERADDDASQAAV